MFKPNLFYCKKILFNRNILMQLSMNCKRNIPQNSLNYLGMNLFKNIFQNTIVNDFVNDQDYNDIPDVVNTFKEMLEEVVPNGNKIRPISFLNIYERMEDNKNLSTERIKLACILAWCIEMIHGSSTIIDDVFDKSEYRRGKKCWYKREGVGQSVFLDVIVTENYVYQIINKYFSHLKINVPFTDLFQKAVRMLAYGQILDESSQYPSHHHNLNKFRKSYYKTLVKYKLTPSIIDLPYNSARCLSNKYQTKISKEQYEICTKLGEFYQIQNDFMDCYDNELLNLRTSNDIEEGKCTWLIVTALENANPQQRKLVEKYYGKKDPESVAIIKELYQELKIPKLYKISEEEFFDFIDKNLEQVSNIAYHNIIFKRLDSLYNVFL